MESVVDNLVLSHHIWNCHKFAGSCIVIKKRFHNQHTIICPDIERFYMSCFKLYSLIYRTT